MRGAPWGGSIETPGEAAALTRGGTVRREATVERPEDGATAHVQRAAMAPATTHEVEMGAMASAAPRNACRPSSALPLAAHDVCHGPELAAPPPFDPSAFTARASVDPQTGVYCIRIFEGLRPWDAAAK